jgi:hypothetical protein
MTISKFGVIALIAGVVTFLGFEIGEQLSIPGVQGLVPTVEARVGRPLTPVSVAGVARRTVRRCAVGVYNCRVPWFRSMDSRPLQTAASFRPHIEKQPAKG